MNNPIAVFKRKRDFSEFYSGKIASSILIGLLVSIPLVFSISAFKNNYIAYRNYNR
jgi:hypothetical protein